MIKQRNKLTHQLQHHRHSYNDQQYKAEENKITLLNEKIKCRQYEIELLDYMHQDDFMKCALYIISA